MPRLYHSVCAPSRTLAQGFPACYTEDMEDRTRLHEIEMILDETGPDSPYRVSRQRLNREKERILKRLNGKDPRWFASGKKKGGVLREHLKSYGTKKTIIDILKILEV